MKATKPILLLAPPRARPAGEHLRLDLRRVTRLDAIDDAEYGSVIVVNDGGAQTVRRLQLALALREQHKELPVAVLTYLEPPGDAAVCCWPRADSATPRAALAELGPELSVELRDEVLSLEYQAH